MWLVGLVCLGAVGVAAQSDAIQYGDTVSGTLSDENPQALYTFDGEAGDRVTITMTATEFDSFLALLGSDDTVIAEDDDGAGRLNAEISLTLEADDTYVIVATSLRAYRSGNEFASSGDYTLTLSEGEPADTIDEPETEQADDPLPELTYGDVVTGEIDRLGEPVPYTFAASADDEIVITLESDDFDAYLILEGPDGDPIEQNDDYLADGLNAQIRTTIPAEGVYTIVVSSYGRIVGLEAGTGAFQLTLELAGAVTEEAPPPEDETITTADLMYDDPLEARLSDSEPDREYTFDAEAGDLIMINLESQDFDTYLELFGPDDEYITEDDDGGLGLNSRIGPLEITEAGTYTVRATSYTYFYGDGTETGLYTLRLETIEAAPLALDETIEATINAETPALIYEVEGEAGDVVVFTLDTANFAIYLRVSGNGITQETFGGADQVGPLTLPADGLYIVEVNAYDLVEEMMDFTLTTRIITPEAVTYDDPIQADFDTEPVRVYTFEGQAEDVIDVRVQGENDLDTMIELTTPSGTVYIQDDDSGAGVDPELLGVVLPEDGTYTLIVSPYITGDLGSFEVVVSNTGNALQLETPRIVRVSDKANLTVLSFDAEAGQVYQLSARAQVDAGGETLVTIRQGEAQLAQQTLGQVDRLIIEFTPTDDGPVLINVEDISFEGAVIEFTITTAGIPSGDR